MMTKELYEELSAKYFDVPPFLEFPLIDVKSGFSHCNNLWCNKMYYGLVKQCTETFNGWGILELQIDSDGPKIENNHNGKSHPCTNKIFARHEGLKEYEVRKKVYNCESTYFIGLEDVPEDVMKLALNPTDQENWRGQVASRYSRWGGTSDPWDRLWGNDREKAIACYGNKIIQEKVFNPLLETLPRKYTQVAILSKWKIPCPHIWDLYDKCRNTYNKMTWEHEQRYKNQIEALETFNAVVAMLQTIEGNHWNEISSGVTLPAIDYAGEGQYLENLQEQDARFEIVESYSNPTTFSPRNYEKYINIIKEKYVKDFSVAVMQNMVFAHHHIIEALAHQVDMLTKGTVKNITVHY
jgi:hypothetical protein